MINIGLEGVIIGGAFGALVCAGAGSASLGFVGAAFAGILVAAIFAFFVVTLRTDQIITGTAMSMLGLGLTGTLYRTMYGSAGASLHTPTIAPVFVPGLSAIPVLGPALFEGISPGYGYTAIAVALLAQLNPLAVVAAGIFFGALEAGGAGMQRDAGVPAGFVSVIVALVILGVLAVNRARTLASERAPPAPGEQTG